jgi:hypothetical protein
LRERLSRCRIILNESGVLCESGPDGISTVYRNLPANLRGAWMLSVGDTRFMVGRTRSTWVLLYDRSPESLYEDPGFMAVDFRKRDVLVLDNGKSMFLSRVSREEIDALNILAARSSGKKTPQNDTIAPPGDGSVSYDDVRGKLKAATVVHSSDVFFDMGRFADSIRFITTLQDADGNAHYYLVAGEAEKDYWLYINNADAPPPKGCTSTTRFRYKDDSCILYGEG